MTDNMQAHFLSKIRTAATAEEYNTICDEVKRYTKVELTDSQRSGEYPEWWYRDVILSGLVNRFY